MTKKSEQSEQSEKNKVEHEEQMRTKLENFKDNHGESPEFDNPHAWTQEEMDLMYARISGELNAAWSIKLMALAHHMKKGPYTEGEYEGTARIADPRYREDRSY